MLPPLFSKSREETRFLKYLQLCYLSFEYMVIDTVDFYEAR